MKITIRYGQRSLELDVPEARLTAWLRGPEGLASPQDALAAALESPLNYPPLRRAVTANDRIALVLDECLPRLPNLVEAILQHITPVGVQPGDVSLVLPNDGPGASAALLAELGSRFPECVLERHDPAQRGKLSYLAGTAAGRALYVNRLVVDADQVVVLTGRRFDPVLGHAGGELLLFPGLADEAARNEQRPVLDEPTSESRPIETEAGEVTWLLGAPFFAQCIHAAGDGIARVIAGPVDSCREGRRLLAQDWSKTVPQRADVVVASVAGTPEHHDFADVAQAAATAAQAVRPGGRIVLLSDVTAFPTGKAWEGSEMILRADEPRQALANLERASVQRTAALQWARAVCHARISLLSRLPEPTVEDLFAAPLANEEQALRLLAEGESCVVLEDAHRLRVSVA